MKPDRHPPARRRLRTVVRAVAAAAVVLALAGLAYQQLAERRDAQRFPPPGRLVDIGGHRLHLLCAGTGTPTVLLEAGLGNDVNHWSGLFEALAGEGRVCAYDRAGLGWSEAGPMPRTPARLADETARLLAASGEAAPFVLVGHSNGGAHVRLLAQARPGEIAGMVLVDPNAPHPDGCPPMPFATRAGFGTLAALAGFGLPRLLLPTLFPLERSALPAQARTTHGALRARTAALRAVWSEARAGCDLIAAAEAVPWPAGVPVEVLSAGRRPPQLAWVPQAHRAMAQAAGGRWTEVAGAGHWIQLEQPEAVLAAIRRVRSAPAGN